MRWNYTKTLLYLAVAAAVIRCAPLLWGHDPFGPHAIGGTPIAGLIYLIVLGPFFVAADVISWLRERRRARAGRQGYATSSPPASPARAAARR